MIYRVQILRRANQKFRVLLRFLQQRSAAGASAWANAFDDALRRLERDADSFPLVPESRSADVEVREILFKTRRGLVYRALFMIEQNDVYILHVRGPGQDLLNADELLDL